MATMSKSDAGLGSKNTDFDNDQSSDDVISIGNEEVSDDNDDSDKENDVNTTGSLTSLRSSTSASNLITPSQKSLRKKTMLKNHHSTSALSMRSFTSQDGDDHDQETYHFEESDDVINTESNHSSQQELNLSSTSFSNFGKYERAQTATEEDLVTAQQFMYSLAKVRIYMD